MTAGDDKKFQQIEKAHIPPQRQVFAFTKSLLNCWRNFVPE